MFVDENSFLSHCAVLHVSKTSILSVQMFSQPSLSHHWLASFFAFIRLFEPKEFADKFFVLKYFSFWVIRTCD